MPRSKAAFDFLMQFWHYQKVERWAARQPILKHIVRPNVSPERNQHIIIPINHVIHGTESVVLPPAVLEELISRASTVVAMNECLCRRAEHCHHYPIDMGCLFLGDAAGQINPGLCRPLEAAQAAEHARAAVERRLTPMIVHSAFDSELLGIDYRRMLAICFCCDCCCTVRQGLRSGLPGYGNTMLRFPGLQVEVGVGCTLCGACAKVCPVGAIARLDGHMAVADTCVGCGRCASVCPEKVIRIRLDQKSHSMDRLFSLVEERTTIEPVK